MKPRAFAVGIPQQTVYNHLSFHFGQCVMLLHLGFRDGNDMMAATVLGLYIQEQAVTWQKQRIEAKRIALRKSDDCIGSPSL